MTSRISRRLLPALFLPALLLAAALSGCAPAGQGTAVIATTPDRTTIVAVSFQFDSHTIDPAYYGSLDQLAAAMISQRLAGVHFDIDGHTDIIGRLGYNIALSVLRAQAVVDYLVSRGVPRESMIVQGFGPLHLLDPSNPASPSNRRVEVTSLL